MSNFEILTEEKKNEIARIVAGKEKRNELLQANLMQVSTAYVSALNLIHDLAKLTKTQHYDRFGACVHCKKHRSLGCSDNCDLQVARIALAHFNNQYRNQSDKKEGE